jgi:hypothetical protein
MTDRELLELAAKAAGLRVGFEPDRKERGRYDLYWSRVHSQLVWHNKSTGSEYPEPLFWNPRTYSGQALELAVKLRMCIGIVPSNIRDGYATVALAPANPVEIGETHIDDPIAATRRAIVRAAAEIGRSMT